MRKRLADKRFTQSTSIEPFDATGASNLNCTAIGVARIQDSRIVATTATSIQVTVRDVIEKDGWPDIQHQPERESPNSHVNSELHFARYNTPADIFLLLQITDNKLHGQPRFDRLVRWKLVRVDREAARAVPIANLTSC